MMIDVRGKRVLVMGLGVHGGGLGVARWLLQQGAQVTVTDQAPAERLTASLAALRQVEQETGATVRYVLGRHAAEDFTGHDMLVVNPAVPPDSPWLELARTAGVPIETQMTLFFRRCPGPIIGITGTKGKSTTTLLTGAMLRQQCPDTVIAGNVRASALEALDRITPTTPVVLELSSFQLVGLGAAQLSPQYAAITNLSPDHLNYHGSMEEYAAAKRQIYAWQQSGNTVVLNLDDAPSAHFFAGPWPGHLVGCINWNPHDEPAAQAQRVHLQSWSLPLATIILRYGAAVYQKWYDPNAYASPAELLAALQDADRLFDLAEVQLPGEHNVANVLMATALAYSFGISPAQIRAAIRSFAGVEHRLELVAELDGVRYINDTTATNPAAAQAALESFDAPLILLAGGADKQLDPALFARTIARRVKALVLLAGSATERLQREVRAQGFAQPIAGPFDDFAVAIRVARDLAEPGDLVLLSPGCASFGMFHNEFHRGEEFRRIVRDELAADSKQTGTTEDVADNLL
jgi:UDP-N-acetylmuramoylalanine--D-glutamate ligase